MSTYVVICVLQENRRLEVELLDNAEKLVEAQSQIAKLQTSMDNVMREKVHVVLLLCIFFTFFFFFPESLLIFVYVCI